MSVLYQRHTIIQGIEKNGGFLWDWQDIFIYFYYVKTCILNWYFLQETTHNIVMLDQNVFVLDRKKNSHMFAEMWLLKTCWQNVLC